MPLAKADTNFCLKQEPHCSTDNFCSRIKVRKEKNGKLKVKMTGFFVHSGSSSMLEVTATYIILYNTCFYLTFNTQYIKGYFSPELEHQLHEFVIYDLVFVYHSNSYALNIHTSVAIVQSRCTKLMNS